MSGLLIQATPALLDGWCGPVLLDDGKTPAIHLGIQHPRAGWVALGELSNHGLQRPVVEPVQQPVASVRLDLSRAEARDRVARVLADTAGEPGAVAPWWMGRDTYTTGPLDFVLTRPGCWASKSEGCTVDAWSGGRAPMHSRARLVVEVPALATLDPSDDTRLPDGSRRVDALALAMVWREVSDG